MSINMRLITAIQNFFILQWLSCCAYFWTSDKAVLRKREFVMRLRRFSLQMRTYKEARSRLLNMEQRLKNNGYGLRWDTVAIFEVEGVSNYADNLRQLEDRVLENLSLLMMDLLVLTRAPTVDNKWVDHYKNKIATSVRTLQTHKAV